MANYRLDEADKYQKEYHDNRQTLNQRRQPERVIRGNYRVDRNGQPIVRQNPPTHDNYYKQSARLRYDEVEPELAYEQTSGVYDRYQPQWQRQVTAPQVRPYLPKGKMKLFSVFVLLCLVLVVAGWRMMPMHYVNGVTVSGNRYVATEDIAASTGIEPWFTVKNVMAQRKEIESNVMQANPLISSVTLQRDNWASIHLVVEERQIVARMQEGERWIPVLDNGVWGDTSRRLLAQQAVDLMQYPILLATGASGRLTELTTMLKETPSDIRNKIETIQLSRDANKPMAIEAKMKDGNLVKGITSTFNQKMKYYDKMVAAVGQRKGTINLEVGAYFTPYNGQQTQTQLPVGQP